MKLIGIEEHYLTADVRDAWDAIGLAATPALPSTRARSSGGCSTSPGSVSP